MDGIINWTILEENVLAAAKLLRLEPKFTVPSSRAAALIIHQNISEILLIKAYSCIRMVRQFSGLNPIQNVND